MCVINEEDRCEITVQHLLDISGECYVLHVYS